MRKEFIVGIVFVAALILTALGTIAVTGLSLFSTTQTWYIRTTDAGGLMSGDDVKVLGARMGRVRSIDFDSSRNEFVIRTEMDNKTPIREGYEISIRETSALGGRYINVEPGPPQAQPADRHKLQVKDPGLSGGIPEILAELRKTVDAINNARGTLGKIIMQDDLYKDLKETSESLKNITAQIESGKGTVGRLVMEEEVYVQLYDFVRKLNEGNSAISRLLRDDSGVIIDDLAATVANLKSVTAKIDNGQGTIGKLVNDPALYNNASTFMENVNEGRGVLGMLINDEAARENAANVLNNLDDITTKMKSGEGTLGRLLSDEKVYDNLASLTDRLNNFAGQLEDGNGTIGKLVNDPELYEMVRKLVSRAIDSVENARDSAPVTAITGFLLSPFQ